MIELLTPNSMLDHQLLDSGDGLRLERFGNNIVSRPDAQCIWKKQSPSLWEKIDAICTKQSQGAYQWATKASFKEPWTLSYTLPTGKKLNFLLRFSPYSKNIGIFPEQAPHWEWITNIIDQHKEQLSLLNLFAYTGGATLSAAAAGAKVCHVDASQAAIKWAQQNHQLNQLPPDSVRWIVDDCATFVQREIKRHVTYDALIMDPPVFGRSGKTKIFAFETEIYKLLELCTKVLKKNPLFFIFNGYASGYSATILKNLMHDFYPSHQIEWGELHLTQSLDQTLPCSIYARLTQLSPKKP